MPFEEGARLSMEYPGNNSQRKIFISLFFSFLVLFGLLGGGLTAQAGSPVPDTEKQRPDFNTFGGTQIDPDKTQIRNIPANASCREKSSTSLLTGGTQTTLMCVVPGSDEWRLDVCEIAPEYVVKNCTFYRGVGDRSVTRTDYRDYYGLAWSVETVDSETGETTPTEGNVVGTVIDGLGNFSLQAVALFVWFLTEILIQIALFILSIVGSFFDFISVEFVNNMGRYITAPNAGAIREAWTIIRDLANIGIIGGLVATAIGTIIGSGSYNVNKTLARLILAALLVNFSYFFAGAIIDVSNFTARTVYENLVQEDGCKLSKSAFLGACGIAARVAADINIDTIGESFKNSSGGINEKAQGLVYRNIHTEGGGEEGAKLNDELDKSMMPSAIATYNVMYLIFICITTFVFLSAIALLVGRFVVLIFLLVTSPIGIAGPAIPILNKYAKEWWEALASQAVFAPIYFLLAGISLKILEYIKGGLLNGQDAALAKSSGYLAQSLEGMVQITAIFTIAIGFMWAALEVAKSMSAEAKRFKPIYDGVQKYLTKPAAGFLSRETLGRAAFKIGQVYPGAAARVQEWSKGKGAIATLGRNIGKYTGLGELVKAGARGTDRLIQKRLDKTGDQKFFGLDGYKSIDDAKRGRKIQLDAKKKDLENQDEEDGRKAKQNLKEKEKDLKKQLSNRAKELADLEKREREKKLTPEDEERLKKLREEDTERKRLEEAEKDGTIDKKGLGRLAELRKTEDALKEIEELKAGLKSHPNGGVKKGHHGGIGTEGDELEALYEERRGLMAQGPRNTLSPENQRRFDEVEAKIKAEEAFEKLKDDNKWGGTQGAARRAESKWKRAVADGAILEGFNEEAHYQDLRRRATAAGVMSATEERDFTKAISTAAGERTPAQEALIRDPNRKLASFEQQALAHYEQKLAPLTNEEKTRRETYKAKQSRGELVDEKEVADLEELEQRFGIAGTEDGSASGAGLSTKAKENFAAFRMRQNLREDGMGRNVNEVLNEKTGRVELTPEGLFDYKYRLETNDNKTGYRAARGERNRVIKNFSPNYLKDEYKKNPNRIIKYANALTSEDWLKVAGDHEYSEEILNDMWAARMKPYTDSYVSLQQDILDGKVIKGSAEYNERKLDMYNWVTKYVPNNEYLEALKQDAVVGELHNKAGGEMHVRMKDLNTKTEEFGNLRELTWNTSSSTAFADAKDARVYGTEQTAEIARAKRIPIDTPTYAEAAGYQAMGLSGDDFFLRRKEDTVQLDSEARGEGMADRILKESQDTIKAYENLNTRGNLNTTDYTKALRGRRFAELHQASLREEGPLNEIVTNIERLDQASLNDARKRVAAAAKVTEADISDQDLRSYLIIEATTQEKKRLGAIVDPREIERLSDVERNRKFFFEYQEEIEGDGTGWFRGKNEREVKSVLNKRNLHSTMTYKGIQEQQIPAVLQGQDGQEVERFWEGMFLFRSKAEIASMIRNPAIQAVYSAPSPEMRAKINIRRVAMGSEPIDFG